MRTHILLLDENIDSRKRIKFLLHISGYVVTEFALREDAENWISNARRNSRSFDLLLVNYLDATQQTTNFVAFLNAIGSIVPSVLLSRAATENYSTDHIEQYKNKPGYFICFPDEMINTVHSVVNKSTQRMSDAS